VKVNWKENWWENHLNYFHKNCQIPNLSVGKFGWKDGLKTTFLGRIFSSEKFYIEMGHSKKGFLKFT
jgi:hypothetical protein